MAPAQRIDGTAGRNIGGRRPRDDQSGAVRALIEGVDSPSLPLLAGLSWREEGDEHDLFRAVVCELDLAPPAPLDTRAERWNLVRWLCEAIVDESVDPEVAGD